MTAALVGTVPIRCPQCYRFVHVTAERLIDEDGALYVEAEPVRTAIDIHTRSPVGCTAVRRER